jgi:hypothetical protein
MHASAVAALAAIALVWPYPAAALRTPLSGADAASHARLTATSRAPLLGVTVTTGHDLGQDEAQFGHLPIVHVYYSGLPPANAWSGTAGKAGAAVIASFAANPSAVLSGADNAALSHFFDTAPRNHRVYYSYIHEPEHAVNHEGLNVTLYREAWLHVAALAAKANNPELIPTLILEEYDLRLGSRGPAANRNWKQYITPVIKVLAWDTYPAGTGKPMPPSFLMAPAIAATQSLHLAYGFAEFGIPTAQGRATWLNEIGGYLMSSGALFGTYFDSSIYRGYRLTDTASVAAWRHWVQASAQAAG